MAQRSRNRALAAGLACVFLLAGCRSNGWVYRNSSRYYRDPDGVMSEGLMTYGQAGIESALVSVLWPFVVDTLALPVTLVHDRFFMPGEEPAGPEEASPAGEPRLQLATSAAHTRETR